MSNAHSIFKNELKAQGLGTVPVFDAVEPCTHSYETKCVLYVKPDPEEDEEYEGWHKYEGCKECVTELGEVFFCGGLYLDLRMFEGEIELS